VSLVPMHGPAEGVTTEGLVYALRGETLNAGSSRGTSNVFADPEAAISVGRGVLLAVRPAPSFA
jgi:thiamine pyrophosphokinase